jgi:hypothetical protein
MTFDINDFVDQKDVSTSEIVYAIRYKEKKFRIIRKMDIHLCEIYSIEGLWQSFSGYTEIERAYASMMYSYFAAQGLCYRDMLWL